MSIAACTTFVKKKMTCDKNREVRIGRIGLMLPECCSVVFSDSFFMNKGFITSEGISKVEFSVDGLGKSELLDDTTMGDIFHMYQFGNSVIQYGRKDDDVYAVVASADMDTTSILSLLGDRHILFIASSIQGQKITNAEAIMFIDIFKKIKVYDK